MMLKDAKPAEYKRTKYCHCKKSKCARGCSCARAGVKCVIDVSALRTPRNVHQLNSNLKTVIDYFCFRHHYRDIRHVIIFILFSYISSFTNKIKISCAQLFVTSAPVKAQVSYVFGPVGSLVTVCHACASEAMT